MTADLHARAKGAFLQAVSLDPGPRDEFLDKLRGQDPELYQEVEQLLEHHFSQSILPAADTEKMAVHELPTVEVQEKKPRAWTPRRWLARSHQPTEMLDETSQVLRHRLRAGALVLVVTVGVAFIRGLIKGADNWAYTLPILLTMAGGLAVLASRAKLDLFRLRIIELVVWGALALLVVVADGRAMIDAAGRGSVVDTVSAELLNLSTWALIILIYGIFMPNNWKRAAAVLIPAASVPYILTAILRWRHERIDDYLDKEMPLILVPAPILAAAAAIYAANIIYSARREAFEAKKLGQYRLKRRLGAGGMGEVYEAEHELLKRPCAIKLIRPGREAEASAQARFEREVMASAKLSHWNTIDIYDYGHTTEGTFYYVMELLPGLNLGQIVQRFGPLPPARAVHFLRHACNALQEAHGIGLIHRDIKPENIFAAKRGGIYDVGKLLDFGLVREVKMPTNPQLSARGTIGGTPWYMSPEQIVDYSNVTGLADIYSLGAVGYFLLSGHPPFQGDSVVQTLLAHVGQPVRSFADVGAEPPQDVQQVVLKCLEKSPEKRFASAQALEAALAACACAGQWTQQDAEKWWQQTQSVRQKPDSAGPSDKTTIA